MKRWEQSSKLAVCYKTELNELPDAFWIVVSTNEWGKWMRVKFRKLKI